MSKERFEWLYNETMLKHYMVDNQNNIQLGYEAIVNLLNQQNKQIADLEAKLAESESELEKQKEKYDKLYECYKKTSNEDLQDKYRLAEENEELKQQLAEKEKEILDVKNWWSYQYNGEIERHHQDKISLCIEKLTDVRSFVSDATEIKEPDYTKVCNYIEKQIEELKKGVE